MQKKYVFKKISLFLEKHKIMFPAKHFKLQNLVVKIINIENSFEFSAQNQQK
jgi:hypothetical protein